MSVKYSLKIIGMVCFIIAILIQTKMGYLTVDGGGQPYIIATTTLALIYASGFCLTDIYPTKPQPNVFGNLVFPIAAVIILGISIFLTNWLASSEIHFPVAAAIVILFLLGDITGLFTWYGIGDKPCQ